MEAFVSYFYSIFVTVKSPSAPPTRNRSLEQKLGESGQQVFEILHVRGAHAGRNASAQCLSAWRSLAPIVLYEYQPNLKAEHAKRFLDGSSDWLHADGYQGYHRLPGYIRVVGCGAHARRKFDKALQTVPKERGKVQ